MADAGRWKPYVRRQGQLLPAFVEDELDPMRFRRGQLRGRAKVGGAGNLVATASTLRRLFALGVVAA